jgi:hypothetical protein
MQIDIKPERAIELIEKIARFIAEKKMAPAAIMTIESLRPLNFIASQALYFLAPFAEVIFKPKEYEEFAAMMEKDEYIKLLIKRIDEIDTEMHFEERKQRRKLRKRRINKIKKFIRKLFKR